MEKVSRWFSFTGVMERVGRKPITIQARLSNRSMDGWIDGWQASPLAVGGGAGFQINMINCYGCAMIDLAAFDLDCTPLIKLHRAVMG